jgi:hypothetical protein
MRNLAGLLSALAIALAAFAAPAGADPAKSGGLITEPFDCGGTVMSISHGSGFSGWDIADGQHYVLAFIIYQQDGVSVAAHNFGVKNGMSVGVICRSAEVDGQSIIVGALPVPPANS